MALHDDEKIIYQTVKMLITSTQTASAHHKNAMFLKGRYCESLFKKIKVNVGDTLKMLETVSTNVFYLLKNVLFNLKNVY